MLHKIAGQNAHGPVSHLTPETELLLRKPFTFLSKGGQCYAFMSEDGTAVLKFFKQHHIRFWNRMQKFSFGPFEDQRKRLIERHTYQSSFLFDSCQIALEELPEKTGLLYVHLDTTNLFPQKAIIYDNLGIAHEIDLDHTDFILQKRVKPSYSTLSRLIKNQKIDEAKQCLDSLVDLIREKKEKGIADRDFNVKTNIGFLGTTAIEIDVGSFSRVGPLMEEKKIALFRQWLAEKNQELYLHFNEKLREVEPMFCSNSI